MQDEPKGLGHAVFCARDHVLPGYIRDELLVTIGLCVQHKAVLVAVSLGAELHSAQKKSKL